MMLYWQCVEATRAQSELDTSQGNHKTAALVLLAEADAPKTNAQVRNVMASSYRAPLKA
jgi:hypothetical protein